ncbi:MAG: ABC transporter substrate-binding protein [Chloroflexota bacterium]
MIILQPSLRLADPHICTDFKDRLNVYTAIFDTLVRRDLSGRFVPQLAKSWQVSDDAKTWTFALRNNVIFHNGDGFSAADVVANLKRACDPVVGGELGTEGVWASYIGDAECVSLDETTVQLTLSRPMADLCELLMAIPILPKAVLSESPLPLIGSGPYRPISVTDHTVVLEPFNRCVTRQPSSAENLEFRAEPDEAQRLAAVQSGEAAMATALSAGSAEQLGESVMSYESNLCVAMLINCMTGPGTNRNLRQALNYAINTQEMIDQARGGAAIPLNGPLTDLHFGCDSSIPPYSYDPAGARELVELAKAEGFDGKLDVDIPMILPDESPLLGDMLKQYCAAVGIEVTLHHYEDRPAYAHMVKRKDIHDVCCFDSSPLSTYRVLHEKINSYAAGPWWQGYDNPKVNNLLDQAARTVDDDARQKIYYEAYQMMHEDAPWIFLYRPTYFFGISGELPTVVISPEGILRFEK